MSVEEAIEGGWDKESFSATHLNLRVANTEIGGIDMPLDCVFLDPLFWESLGKALIVTSDTVRVMPATDFWVKTKNGKKKIHREPYQRNYSVATHNRWKKMWHRFIDALAAGKRAEEFFKGLN